MLELLRGGSPLYETLGPAINSPERGWVFVERALIRVTCQPGENSCPQVPLQEMELPAPATKYLTWGSSQPHATTILLLSALLPSIYPLFRLLPHLFVKSDWIVLDPIPSLCGSRVTQCKQANWKIHSYKEDQGSPFLFHLFFKISFKSHCLPRKLPWLLPPSSMALSWGTWSHIGFLRVSQPNEL